MRSSRWAATGMVLFVLVTPAVGGDARSQVVAHYTQLVYESYVKLEVAAKDLRAALLNFLADPTEEFHAAAKSAWLGAHEAYAPTEAFRFYDGPIDDVFYGPETLLNGWPMDEAYIDYVVGHPGAGIINQPDVFLSLQYDTLVDLNERSGEKNITTGFHAIEFLLWGQDTDPTGPGSRSYTDYVDDSGAPHPARRREYLRTLAELLVEHVRSLTQAWLPEIEGNYAGRFRANEPDASLWKIFVGIVSLARDELGAERIAVAYETRDQEDETSCFSDSTLTDLVGNIRGVQAVYLGVVGEQRGPGLNTLVRAADADLDALIRKQLNGAVAAIEAIPAPFDQTLLGVGGGPGRSKMLAAIEALEAVSNSLVQATSVLGLDPVPARDTSNAALPREALAGGDATVFDESIHAFSLPARTLTGERRRQFAIGNAFFNENWVTAPSSTVGRDGLGPLFNARSCSACHPADGRGDPLSERVDRIEPLPGLLLRLSVPGAGPNGEPLPEPRYGGQLQTLAVLGVRSEGALRLHYENTFGEFADGTRYRLTVPSYTIDDLGYGPLHPDVAISARLAPPVFGLGLIEAIDEEAIRAGADPDDKDEDGVSGRINVVWDIEREKRVLGRFGWKANQPSLPQQVATALLEDIGITSPLFEAENHTAAQHDATRALSGGWPEIDAHKLDRLTFYVRMLAPPARRDLENPGVVRGRALFRDLGCASCHVPSWKTGEVPEHPELSRQQIWPYTDLLLHDMGPKLADGRPDHEASGAEWRTPPLWGLGLALRIGKTPRYLHDGRAWDLQSAILSHGGEAERSRERFAALARDEREALVAFLRSL